MLDLDRKISLLFEQDTLEDSEEDTQEDSHEGKLNPLFKLAILSDPKGVEAIERDLVSLSQATRASLQNFVRGKGNLENVLRASETLKQVSSEILDAAKQVEHQGGIDIQISKPIAKKLNSLTRKFHQQPPDKQEELLGLDDIEGGVESAKGTKRATHVGSYPLTGRGKLRVAVDGENVNQGRLHVFKKAGKYQGYLVTPGIRPIREGFERKVFDIFEESVLMEANEVVLTYASNDIRDLFNFSNYTQQSDIALDELQQYEDSVTALPAHLVNNLNIQAMPWDKQAKANLLKGRSDMGQQATRQDTEVEILGDSEVESEESEEDAEERFKEKLTHLIDYHMNRANDAESRSEREFSDRHADLLAKGNRDLLEKSLSNLTAAVKKFSNPRLQGSEKKRANHLLTFFKNAKEQLEDLLS